MSDSISPVSVCICIPVDDGSRPQFWQSLMNFVTQVPDSFTEEYSFQYVQNIGDSLITRARNNLTHDFLVKSDCDYLLFLDSDLEFTTHDIQRLLSHRKEDAVVCAQYAIKQAEFRMCYTCIKGEVKGTDGLLKVAEAGTGCMLIPRKVLEAFKQKLPELEYTCEGFKDQRFSFFDVGVIRNKETAVYKSEDWLFCRRVRQLGFSVYVDTELLLGHYGWACYPLSDVELIAAIVSRAPTPELLQSYLDDIDKAAKVRWTLLSQQNTTPQSENSKPS